MMVLQGNKVPNTGDALLLMPAWENGYIGHFIKNCFCFCTGCNYTVLVSAKDDGYISLGAKTSNNQVDLRSYEGGETYDTVYDWGAQCYKYEVTDPLYDFTVKLQVFSGDPDAYVNPGEPINLWNYTAAKFNSKDQFWNEEIVLEPKHREEVGFLTGIYYICVYGSTGSAYKISAKNEAHSTFLKAGLSESGYIDHDEIKQYYFTDNLLLDPKARVKFNGHLMSGSVRLQTKLCPKPRHMMDLEKSCNLTRAEMLKYDEDEKVIHGDQGFEEEIPDHNICSGLMNTYESDVDDLASLAIEQFLPGFWGTLYSEHEANCVYVIGIIGIAN